MRSKHSFLFIASLSICILFFSAFLPIADTSLVYADGIGGDPPIPKDTTGANSIVIPDSTSEIPNSSNEIGLLDIIKLIISTL